MAAKYVLIIGLLKGIEASADEGGLDEAVEVAVYLFLRGSTEDLECEVGIEA